MTSIRPEPAITLLDRNMWSFLAQYVWSILGSPSDIAKIHNRTYGVQFMITDATEGQFIQIPINITHALLFRGADEELTLTSLFLSASSRTGGLINSSISFTVEN